ncbi:unnamed protein product [Dovyalis caffra]|uniref:Uncharacterized protein n=1 Tax=Dovyalis caffra TaxID=77055 RepID=A0AAV1SFL1_9ROSI|nr:unnamed protein product [Dovyalis caffra]
MAKLARGLPVRVHARGRLDELRPCRQASPMSRGSHVQARVLGRGRSSRHGCGDCIAN